MKDTKYACKKAKSMAVLMPFASFQRILRKAAAVCWQHPQPLEWGRGWECTRPGVPFPCAHQFDHCWLSWNLIYHPATLYSSASPTWAGGRSGLFSCLSSPDQQCAPHWWIWAGHMGSQGLPPHFLGKYTSTQPLKGTGTPSLGFFLTGMDVGEGVQEDWCETPSEAGVVQGEPPHAKHFHTSLFNWLAFVQALPVWIILVWEGFALLFGMRTLVLPCPEQQRFCLY